MNTQKIKHALYCCETDQCEICAYREHMLCLNTLSHDACTAIEEQEERIAIMQESMEALEKRLDDSGRISVVRCSECQYWNPPTYAEQEDGSTVGHCTAALNGQQTDACWFCADGAR